MALILDRTPTSSPISNLPSDILWRIFYLNAAMDPKSDNDIPALHTLRHTSQVCGLWRTLSLGSPSLWARVINLGYLEQSQEWRDEVVGRTGQADLDIIATHTSMVFSTKCFVSTFVKKHWPRIRSLNVKMFSVDPPSDIKNWNDIAHRPSGLRHLTIQAPPTIIFGFLDSISLVQFPLLESLEICEIHSFKHLEDTDYDSFPPASLPRLRRLKITSPLQVNGTLHFLEKVVPAEDCVLDFAGSTSDDSATQQLAVDIIPRVLPKYLVCAAGVQDYPNNTAHAILTNKCIGFSWSNTPTFPLGAIDPDSFSFRLQESDVSIIPELPDYTIPTFLSCLTSLPLQRIRNLSLQISPPRFISETTNSAIAEFILKLTSVEDIQVDDLALIYLDNLQRQTRTMIVLPSLRNIEVKRKGLQFIRGFLDLRSRMGVDLDTLTLTLRTESMIDVSLLGGLTGLTVRIISQEGDFEQVIAIQ